MHQSKVSKVKQARYYIFDFDSTFIQCETLEVLAEFALAEHPEKEERLAQIKDITNKAMAGLFSYQESLQERLSLLELTPAHLEKTLHHLSQKITPSIERHQAFFQKNAPYIYMISGSFMEFVWPIVQSYGFLREQVFANTLLYDFEGNIKGYDRHNPLAQDQGKVKVCHQLGLQGEIIAIGDGYTDYELKASGQANYFVAFTENIERSTIVPLADVVITELEGLFLIFDS